MRQEGLKALRKGRSPFESFMELFIGMLTKKAGGLS
jgi:hypothetical protein